MEISRCERMSRRKVEPKIIVAVISAALLSKELGEAIAPSKGRSFGSDWAVSHRRMSSRNSSLLNSRSGRGLR